MSSSLSDLIVTIQSGFAQDVLTQLNRDPDLVHAEHPSGVTPLYFAVRHQRPTVVRQMIEMGAEVNPPLLGRVSLLEMAHPLPCQTVYDLLLNAGAKKKSEKRRKSEVKPVYPTIWDLSERDFPVCEAISQPAGFRREASRLSKRRVRQLLTKACHEGEEPLAFRLIEILPSVDYCTEDEGSPLLGAACVGNLNLIQALRGAGSKREIIGGFHFAVDRGHVEVAADFLDAVQKAKNYFEREAPLMALRAAKRGYTRMAELLLPFASPRSVTETKRRIEEWRLHTLDLAAECFDWHDD